MMQHSNLPIIRHWNKLVAFYMVGKCESFSQASQLLNVTQPSISKQISFIEHRLKAQLIDRNQKPVKLTKKGEILFGTVKKVIGELTMVESLLANFDKLLEGEINVFCVSGVFSHWLIDIFLEYKKEFPDIVFNIFGSELKVDVNFNSYDIIISSSNFNDPSIISLPLLNFSLGLFAHQDYLKKYGFPKALDDLKNHKLIALTAINKYQFDFVNWHLQNESEDQGMSNPIMYLNTTIDLFKAAYNGLGIISITRGHPWIKVHDLVELLPEIPSPAYNIYISFKKNYKKVARVERFINQLIQKSSEKYGPCENIALT